MHLLVYMAVDVSVTMENEDFLMSKDPILFLVENEILQIQNKGYISL